MAIIIWVMKKITFFLFLWWLGTDPLQAFTLSNFSGPESMVVDPEDGSYYVSNINGSPLEKDSNGTISKISPTGNIMIEQFIGGKEGDLVLHAPKGLVIVGRNIFVTDIDTVKAFDKKTAKPSIIIDFSKFKVKFLNDIAVDSKGFLYVSDMMTHRIFKINPYADYQVSLFKEGKELSSPNGLLVNPRTGHLIVVTWSPGQILEIDRQGRVHILKKGLTGLDGVDCDSQGNLYVSSFEKGEIYKIAYFGRGALSTFLSGLTTPADISVDSKKGELLIPSTKKNTVVTVSLGPKE
jgi:DNA-binding beta-propeller fold protein YncE